MEPAGVYQGVQYWPRGPISAASVALSADGSTLAVGALIEDSAATGIGGNQADNSAAAGRRGLRVHAERHDVEPAGVRQGVQYAAQGTDSAMSVALSADGSTLAVGADR